MARIGLLEDNCIIARLSATMLNHVGHQVIVYEHPHECLSALSLTDALPGSYTLHRPHSDFALPVEVLILDLHLPEIDGLHILELLQAHPHTRALPLIICTAATDRDVDLALRLAPQAGLIEKPFKMGELVSAVSSALRPS